MRFLILVVVLAGAALASQAPEFAQQYRQRLGGAMDELAAVRADFLRDAKRSNLEPEEALTLMARTEIAFVRERSISMRATLDRYDRLARQRATLERTLPLIRPLAVLDDADRRTLEGTWAQFEPALPLNTAGGVWAGLGGLIAWLLARLCAFPFRRRKRPGLSPAALAAAE